MAGNWGSNPIEIDHPRFSRWVGRIDRRKKIKITGTVQLYQGNPKSRFYRKVRLRKNNMRSALLTAMLVAATATLPTGSISEAQTASEARMGTYRDARPGEPFSLGGKYVYSLRSIDSMPSHRKGYQILLVKVWVTNQSDSIKDFSLQKELSIEIWDKNSNGVARINQAYTEKYGRVSQSLNPEQTAVFLACFEVSDRICREGFKVEFFTENERVFIPMVPVSGALARPWTKTSLFGAFLLATDALFKMRLGL